MAIIDSARIAAAHDGAAELIVRVRYPNGGTTEVTLDHTASASLMTACKATELSDLNGASWELVKDALSVSYNRFQNQTSKGD